jgi:hypothetical protein
VSGADSQPLTPRQREILGRIRRLRQWFLALAASLVMGPVLASQALPAQTVPFVVSSLFAGLFVCAAAAFFVTCPRCGGPYFGYDGLVTGRCQVCRLSCRDADDSPPWPSE